MVPAGLSALLSLPHPFTSHDIKPVIRRHPSVTAVYPSFSNDKRSRGKIPSAIRRRPPSKGGRLGCKSRKCLWTARSFPVQGGGLRAPGGPLTGTAGPCVGLRDLSCEPRQPGAGLGEGQTTVIQRRPPFLGHLGFATCTPTPAVAAVAGPPRSPDRATSGSLDPVHAKRLR